MVAYNEVEKNSMSIRAVLGFVANCFNDFSKDAKEVVLINSLDEVLFKLNSFESKDKKDFENYLYKRMNYHLKNHVLEFYRIKIVKNDGKIKII